MNIALVVIAFNEAHRIGACLDSAGDIVDEVVVVDSGSTDDTVAIAKSKGARVIHHPFEGHVEQKNFARKQSKADWILSLDADERLDEQARASMLQLKKEGPTAEVYGWKRLNHYGTKAIRHGAWYPDKKWRLWRADSGEWVGMNPHDAFEPKEGKQKVWLNGHLIHFSFSGAEDHKQKAGKFAEIAARAYLKAGKKARVWDPMLHATARFVRDLVLLQGWRDGKEGWTIARISAWEVYEKYRLLRKLRQNKA